MKRYEAWDNDSGNIVADFTNLNDLANHMYSLGQVNPNLPPTLSVLEIDEDPDLNAIKIPVEGLRQLAIEYLKVGTNEVGLKDLLYAIQTMYHNSQD